MLKKNHSVFWLFLFLLSGCATVKSTKSEAPSNDWESHFVKMSRLNSWQLIAKVGVQTKEQGSGSVVVDWRQGLDCYRIRVSNGFGQTLARFVGHKGRVTLITPGKEPVQAETLEDVAYLQTGWWIPFSYIQYWALGIPAPFSRFNVENDKNSRLKTLEQADWTVFYDRYKYFSDYVLPGRIRAENQDMKITVVTRDWLPTEDKNRKACKDKKSSQHSLYD